MAESEEVEGQVVIEDRPNVVMGQRVPVKIGHPDTYFYSNVAGVSVSPMDVRIDFGDVTPQGRTTAVLGIALSPEHAAGLALLLIQQVKNFEAEYGLVRNKTWSAMRDTALAEEAAKAVKDAKTSQ